MHLRNTLTLLLASLLWTNALADQVILTNGDRLSGTIVKMSGDTLVLSTAYAGDINIGRQSVAQVRSESPVTLMLEDRELITGRLLAGEDSRARVLDPETGSERLLQWSEIAYLNPPPEVSGRGYRIKGRANLAFTRQTGNTETDHLHTDAEVVARGLKNRFTVGGRTTREKEAGQEIASTWDLYGKYDRFLTRKWYAFTNLAFANDEFKDLNLRTSLGAGMGYQFFEGDTTNLSLEGGLSWVHEDLIVAPDEEYAAGRWALDFDHYLFGRMLQVFHRHQGLLSLEDTEDLVINSETGATVPLLRGFNLTGQVDVDWDNSPPANTKSADVTYLLKLGYAW